jgi:hypothetical protein
VSPRLRLLRAGEGEVERCDPEREHGQVDVQVRGQFVFSLAIVISAPASPPNTTIAKSTVRYWCRTVSFRDNSRIRPWIATVINRVGMTVATER